MPETLSQETVLFEEVQRTSPSTTGWTFLAGGGAIAGAAFFAASRGELAKALPGLVPGGLVVATVIALISATRLRSRVTSAGAEFTYGIWGRVTVRRGEIASVSMKQFGMFDGGVGLHRWRKQVAITARTGDGVVITCHDGRRILVGTEHPDALSSALLRLQAQAGPGL